MNQRIACFGIVAALGGLAACSNTGTESRHADPSTGRLTLKLAAEGKDLRLVESGRAGYTALYTNRNRIADMIVRVKVTGAIVATCHDAVGAVVRCGSTPFFTKVTQVEGTTVVRVTDVHGEYCGEEAFPGEETESADSSGCEGDEGEAGSPSSGGSTKETTSGGSDSGSSSGASGSDSGGSCGNGAVIAQRDAFCKAVNDYLTGNGMAPIDCATLDAPGDFDDAEKVKGAAEVDCSDIWEPAYETVDAWVEGCSKSVETRAEHWHEVVRWNLLMRGACDSSPIVLDLDGNGFSASTPENGVRFDLLGRGPVQTAWIEGADAFLALDRDGNGRIDGAAELFGNATRGARFDDGFAALAELDTNGDGQIDSRDAAYGELVLWRDANRDGMSTESELVTLHDAGIRSLFLSAARITGDKMFDTNHNRIPLLGGFEREGGTKGTMADIFLRFKP